MPATLQVAGLRSLQLGQARFDLAATNSRAFEATGDLARVIAQSRGRALQIAPIGVGLAQCFRGCGCALLDFVQPLAEPLLVGLPLG